MAVGEKYIEKAAAAVRKRREENALISEQRHAEVLKKLPEYGKLEIDLANTMQDVIFAVAAKAENAAEIVKKTAEKNLAIQKEMEETLRKGGFEADYLEPLYDCKKCRDSGVFEGKWCDCVEKAAVKFAAEELNARSPLELCGFENFDLSLYEGSDRDMMKTNFEDCLEFVDGFGKRPQKGLFMVGGTGLGKTHLSLACANALIKKGAAAVYNSVPELLQQIKDEQFNKSEGITQKTVSECELLILDDLGAENASEFNSSIIYQIINARQSRGLATIVSTNLEISEVKNIYGDRVCSRLLAMKVLLFKGSDNRVRISRK